MSESKDGSDDVLQLGECVLVGELRNTRRNGIFGWLQFATDFVVRIELTGNFPEELHRAGWNHFRFETAGFGSSPLPEPEDLPEAVQNLSDRQIGVVARVLLGSSERSAPEPVVDESSKELANDPNRVVFEWHSQNGHMLIDVVCTLVQRVERDPSTDAAGDEQAADGSAMVTLEDQYAEIDLDEERRLASDRDEVDEDGEEDDEAEEESDPYGLFETDIDQAVSESLSEGRSETDASTAKPWEESSEGLDETTRALYEQWDEIFEGKKDQPISYLFHKTLRLPRPEAVQSPTEAEGFIREILSQLALLSVALDVCEHFTPLDTYRLLMNEILPTAKVHPNLAASEMVQHYSTSDHCQACEAEFDADYRPPSETDPEGGSEEDLPD